MTIEVTMKRFASFAVGMTLLLVYGAITAMAQNQAPSTSENGSAGQSLGD
jgi:hypothetical protein